MSRNLLSAFFLAVFATFATGQLTCPVCTNKYDHNSCLATQICGVEWNFCELIVNTADYYSLEYVCQEHSLCTNHEVNGCNPASNPQCSYCCEDEVTCQLQRDDLFTYVFPTAGPPNGTPNPVVTTPSPPAGPIFSCPRCTDPYDHTTCTEVQDCSSTIYDICELEVHTADRNRVEYSCQKYADCVNHEVFGCHPELRGVCTYCCLDPIACQLQRDDIFNFVFPPSPTTVRPRPLIAG